MGQAQIAYFGTARQLQQQLSQVQATQVTPVYRGASVRARIRTHTRSRVDRRDHSRSPGFLINTAISRHECTGFSASYELLAAISSGKRHRLFRHADTRARILGPKTRLADIRHALRHVCDYPSLTAARTYYRP